MESSPEPGPETIQGRLRKFMVTLKDQDTLEILEDTIVTIECLRYWPRIVPERRLSSTRVCRQHFLQWDPQVFMPGPTCQSVSFPPDRDVTDSNVYLWCNRAYTSGSRAGTGGDRAGIETGGDRAGTEPALAGTEQALAVTETALAGTEPGLSRHWRGPSWH